VRCDGAHDHRYSEFKLLKMLQRLIVSLVRFTPLADRKIHQITTVAQCHELP